MLVSGRVICQIIRDMLIKHNLKKTHWITWINNKIIRYKTRPLRKISVCISCQCLGKKMWSLDAKKRSLDWFWLNFKYTWNPKQPVLNGWKWWFPTISYIKIWKSSSNWWPTIEINRWDPIRFQVIMKSHMERTTTPWKFNSLPLKLSHPKRKVIFQPSVFRGYVKLRGCTCWLFQPIWKILQYIVKLDHFPKVRGENQKSLKPPPRQGL